MNRSHGLRLVLSVCVALSGCDAMMYRPFAPGNAMNRDGHMFGSGHPDAAEIADADYGDPVEQEAAQQQIVDWLALRLKDAPSARYQWGQIEKGWLKDAPIIGGAIFYGYTLRVLVNARNSYGGYSGFEDYAFLFRNGTIVRAYHGSGIPVQ